MYRIIATKNFVKSLKKMDKSVQKIIKEYIEKNLENTKNPKDKGKPLQYNKGGYWRYRVGDYRLICEINDDEIIIILVDVGHRKNIYL